MDGMSDEPTRKTARRGRASDRAPDQNNGDQKPPELDPAQLKREFDKLGAIGAFEKDATEEQIALALRDLADPIRCHKAKEWRAYKDGCWTEIDPSQLGDLTLKLLHPAVRTERRAQAVIKHLTLILSAEPLPEYRTFILQEPERTLLNCANGVLAVTRDTIELLPHSASYNFVNKIETSWDENAECPTFEKTLVATMPDPSDSMLFQTFCGSIFIDDCRFEAALILVGTGKTGKSTILEGISGTLGEALVSGTGLSDLCNPATFSLPRLKTKAVNIGTELDTKEIKESSTFKALVSGELVPNRAIYAGWDEMITHCKLIFAANTVPWFARCTDAEIRRLRMIGCNQKIGKADPTLKGKAGKIAKERAGIFKFMITGLQTALGLTEMPYGGAASLEIMARYTQNANLVESYARENTEFAPSNFVTMADLFEDYWNKTTEIHTHEAIPGKSRFHKEFQRLHPQIKLGRRMIRGRVARTYEGVGIKPELI
jgi:P4 family phage/plasmid primase-like protien